MQLRRRAPARPLVPALVFALVVALLAPAATAVGVGTAPASATTTTAAPLWRSSFGAGAAAAVEGLGGSAAVWDGRANSSFASHAGKDAWNISLPADTRNGSKVRTRFRDLGFDPQRAVRLQYDVFIPNSEALALDVKLPGFGSLPEGRSLWEASSGGSKRADSASIRIHARPAGHWGMKQPYLEAYAYAHSGGGQVFKDWGMYWRLAKGLNATGQSRGDELPVPVGQWSTIAIEAEMNTPGRADGQLRIWLNGVKGIDIDDLRWVDAAPYMWTQTMFETFYNVGSHQSSTLRLADMELGPVATPEPPPTTTTTAPAPPTTTAPAPPTTVAPATTTTTTTAPAPAVTPRWRFEQGTEGWGSDDRAVSVGRETSTVQGRGALRGTMTFPRRTTGVMRLSSPKAHRDWARNGSELGAWVWIPRDVSGSNWKARIEVQDGTSYRYSNGALRDLKPGSWTYVAGDFTGKLGSVYRVTVQVQAWDVGRSHPVIVDTIEQR